MSDQDSLNTPRFDLHDIDPTRRAKVWTDALNEYFYGYETEYPKDFQFGEFEGVIADELRIASMTADPMFVDRGSFHISRDAKDAYYLLLPRGGDITLRQRGNETTLREGQFTFVSTMEPYSYRQKERESFHTLVIPGHLVRSRKPDADDHLGADFGDSGMQGIFADFAASFCRHAPELGKEAFRRTHDSLLDMLAIVLERADANSNDTVVRLAHRRRVINLIETNFARPEVGLAMIAQALGLSPRYVQHILAASGDTVSDLVRKRRVAEACRLLDRRGTSRANVSTIAYAVGYVDPAYFCRVFRQAMGVSPLAYASRND